MTAEEFLAGYAERSRMTPEALLGHGRVVATCHCDEEGCDGFQLISPANMLPWRREEILISGDQTLPRKGK